MKFFTYTYNKSTSVGGIEIVTRFLQDVASANHFNVYELFHGVSCEEIHEEKESVHYIKLPSNESKNNYFIKLLTLVKRRFASYQYLNNNFTEGKGVLVLHHPNILNFIPRAVLKINKVILMQHNAFDVYFNFPGRMGFELNYKYIDNIIVYTEEDKKELSLRYLNKKILDKTIPIPLACRIEISENVRQESYSKKLVTVARIEECAKNFQSMCHVMSLLPEGFTLDIYGAGTEEEVKNLKLLIQNYPQVAYRGITKDIVKTLCNYSVFIMTSHYEGFGQTLIEARSQGLPLVAFNTFDALPSIITNDENGFKVEPFDHNEFARSIERILNSEETYMHYSQNSLLKAKETEASHVACLWAEVIGN